MNDTPASLHAVVRGRVQGVGFRDFVLTRARSLGLAGYTRNLPDGWAVEVIAEGQRQALERLAEQLRKGPRSAMVRDIEIHWGQASGNHDGFHIGH